MKAIHAAGYVYGGTVLLALAGFLTLPWLHDLTNWIWPVKTDWTVTSAEVDGDDLILRGTFVKHRDCEYLGPPGANDEATGDPLYVESTSLGRSKSYPSRAETYPFGPWRVQKGAGKAFSVYHNDRCPGTGIVITRLGRFDAVSMRQLPKE